MHLIHPRRTLAGILATGLLIAGALVNGPAYAAVPTTPFVSEIHYDNAAPTRRVRRGATAAGHDRGGLTLVLYNGSGGAAYGTLTLPAVTAPAGTPAVVAVPRLVSERWPRRTGPGGRHHLLDRLSYEGTITAANGPAAGQALPDIGVAELSTQPVGQSLCRAVRPGDRHVRLAGSAAATRGTLNPEVTPAATCDRLRPTRSARSRDRGPRPHWPGNEVTVPVWWSVTCLLGGFYLQDADGDGDVRPPTAFSWSARCRRTRRHGGGQRRRTPRSFSQTQITAGSDVEVCTAGDPSDLPEPADLDLPAGDAVREPLEGMLVARSIGSP